MPTELEVTYGDALPAPEYGSMGDGMEGIIINHVFRSASTAGSNCFLALYKTSPGETNTTGIEVAEAYGYNRLGISGSFIVDKTGGSAINDHSFIFSTATGSWGYVKYWAIRNGSGLGNSGSLLFWGPLGGFSKYDYGRHIDEGERLTIYTGSLKIKITGSYITPLLSGSLLEHYLNNTTFKTGSKIYMGLYNEVLVDNFGVPYYVEISGSVGYQRMSVGWSGSWTPPSAGSSVNAVPFVVCLGVDSVAKEWGYVKGAFFISSASGGEMLFYAPFVRQRSFTVGSGFMINTGLMKISVD